MANISALFAVKKDKTSGKIIELSVSEIAPNPYQPRREFDEGGLVSLALSIKTDGLIQPLTVRKTDSGYELIAGERRLRASIMAGLETVPCIVMEATDRNSALLALVENIQRRDLGYFEEAEAIRKLIELYGMTQEDAALRLGYHQSTLANKLRLLKLSSNEREIISSAGLSERHARAVLRLPEGEKRLEIIKKAAKDGLTVERTEKLIDSALEHQRYEKAIRQGAAVFKDVRLFMNTVNKAVETMHIAGVDVSVDKQTSDDAVEYRIRIPLK